MAALQSLEHHSLVGLRIVVGVIRRSNGKPLGPSGFVGFGQICRELQKIPGGIAPQRLRDFLQFSKNLSKTHKPTGPQWFLI